MKTLLIALMTLGAFGVTTVAISPAAYSKTKKKKKKKGKHKGKRHHRHAEINEPAVNIAPSEAQQSSAPKPGVINNKASNAGSGDVGGENKTVAPSTSTESSPPSR